MVITGFKKGCHVENSGVVHEDVKSLERFQDGLHNRLSAFGSYDAVSICDRLSAGRNNFIGYITGRSEGFSQPLYTAAEIVHENLGSAAPQFECVSTAEASPSSGDECNSAFECEAHGFLP